MKDEDVGQYIESDRRFHGSLIARADNPLLTRMIMHLRANMLLYGVNSEEGRERQRASVDGPNRSQREALQRRFFYFSCNQTPKVSVKVVSFTEVICRT
nr:FCD domain-containing protein [Pusillimonas sp. T7-7]